MIGSPGRNRNLLNSTLGLRGPPLKMIHDELGTGRNFLHEANTIKRTVDLRGLLVKRYEGQLGSESAFLVAQCVNLIDLERTTPSLSTESRFAPTVVLVFRQAYQPSSIDISQKTLMVCEFFFMYSGLFLTKLTSIILQLLP